MSVSKHETKFSTRVHLARWLGHQSWIPLREKEYLLRLLFDSNAGYDLPFEVDFFGHRYHGNANNIIDWSVLIYGFFSPASLSALQHVCLYLRRTNTTINYLDVGANIGHHLLFMSRFTDRIFGFDPNPLVLAQAREKIERNGIKNVELFEIALGERDESAPYYPPRAGGVNIGSGSFVAAWKDNASIPITATIRKADGFLAEQSITNVSVIKIDVEGFEAAVLRGLKPIFERDRPFALLEMSQIGFAELGGEAGLRSALFPRAEIFEIPWHSSRFGHELRPYRPEPRDCELLIVPAEHAKGFSDILVS